MSATEHPLGEHLFAVAVTVPLLVALLAFEGWAASSICTWHIAPLSWRTATAVISLLGLAKPWLAVDHEGRQEVKRLGPVKAALLELERSIGLVTVTLVVVGAAWVCS